MLFRARVQGFCISGHLTADSGTVTPVGKNHSMNECQTLLTGRAPRSAWPSSAHGPPSTAVKSLDFLPRFPTAAAQTCSVLPKRHKYLKVSDRQQGGN